ncbi:virginiamycin B lyase family protein [Rhodoplanes sp. Z2-YC6860]|uniref:virginiamycin B lyase family protein n=1 Tax=Rhodoplanes sp. Z2-YC6860 TaxID=674703 RepID=UPI00078E6A5B|nr:carboxypeptidase regulatory-like domain-containing protein [Rhodoplanes sp. Z2-YC6860]AMN43782.1 hydrolase transmembrane protein [Rhodoplanes sp. Z2-YC6860]
MQRKLMLSITVSAAAMLFHPTIQTAWAQGQAALTGTVSSEAEGKMEGVVVTAQKPGSIVRISVTTDKQGRYAFPENRLEPGDYTITIRAVGYDMDGATKATVETEKTANADIKLKKTKNLASQLTNAEWMMSIPGTEAQKANLLDCSSCHTMERIMRSTHDADEWTQVITRMKGYGAVSQPVKPQPMLDASRSGTPEQYRKMAEYLATINLSSSDHWNYELRTLPRPKGRDTRAIVTEYDMVRPTTEPHDILLDKDGNVWYTDFGEMFIGKFNPKTLKLTEYPIKKFKDKAPTGLLSIDFDHTGKIWFDTMYQGALGNLDPKTGEIAYHPLPPEYNDDRVQLNFTGLRYDVDGKVWTKSVGTQDIFRLDLASNKWEKFHPTDELKSPASIYQVISDSKNNLWMAEFTGGHLGKIDAKTLKVTWYPVPTPFARARRMVIDDQDRITVTEYRGNQVAQFDPKTEKFTEYMLPPYTFPYRASFDKNGDIWASTMSTDRVVRVDTKTGAWTQYLMPTDTNMRTVYVDNTTTPVTFWVGSNHDHRIVKVEPLD